ncbi:paraquat-inducible membrane protein A [Corallincola luteus]|uniref:Paraquat-inducible membrane protein A n=2 Tax=Corallincola TaxID=1775176 RepID=A0A368NP42_9GAMM|nr:MULTISPECIES: paraquat-inducible protein A [Corallincola]RCU51653.1 paraquat-inducible membrane protein A [Corallincola holothuriorum]TCI04811.1 paraquat-inducible membrane protein A [Corallincola luteus]
MKPNTDPETPAASGRAIHRGLVLCHDCHKLNRWDIKQAHAIQRCGRCGAKMHPRKPNSLARTWALSITAALCLIPANILPIMTIISFGKGQSDTIMSGVIALIHYEMYPIALVVFIASVAVPVMKLLGIWILCLSVQFGWNSSPRQRTVLYRMVEFIGKWSMLDVFVIAILVALVNLGALATIEAGHGATAFCLAVVITIFAAESFDSRLIWDQEENRNE